MNHLRSTIAYFDTNIFDNLLKRNGVTAEDEARLRRSIESGRLAVLLSILNIQETIDARDPKIVLPQLRLILSLTDWDHFVKPHDMLLTDDIRHFAWNGDPDRPFLGESVVSALRPPLLRFLNGHQDLRELDDVVDLDRQQKQKFLRGIRDIKAETHAQIEALRDQQAIPPFEQYLEDQGEKVARSLARKVGLEGKCEQRGIGKFLKIRSVRLTYGLSLSFIYGAAVEGMSLDRGASRDLQHPLPAAAAGDVFVTHDEDLAKLLHRVPMRDFHVVTLRELLDEVLEATASKSSRISHRS